MPLTMTDLTCVTLPASNVAWRHVVSVVWKPIILTIIFLAFSF